MTEPSSQPDRSILLRRFPTWPGYLAALAVGATLFGLQSLGRLQSSVTDLVGGLLIGRTP